MSHYNKTSFLRSNFLVLLVFFVSCFGFAQNGINYKAVIKNASGNVVANQLITVQFSILQGVAQTNIYTETHTPTTDINGIIIVNIGEGVVQSGDFIAIDWVNGNTFLNVQVNTGSGLVNLGTTQFKAVPYALYAKHSGDWIKDPTIYNAIYNLNHIGVGTFASTYRLNLQTSYDTEEGLRINSGSQYAKLLSLGGLGSIEVDAPGIIGGRFKILNNGNIGINDNTPTEKLSIGGKIKIVDSTQGAGKILTSDANGVGTWQNININSGFATSNTFLGRSSLINNTTGHSNTAYGDGSLYSNTTGYINTAIGDSSLWLNTSGIANVAVGSVSLSSNTTGSNNVAVGYSSLYSNTTGINNVATGNGSLYRNTTGINNTATGHQSLKLNTTGSSNTAIGYLSLPANTAGWDNTAIGYNSLAANTTGNYNTAVGKGALMNVTSGLNNTGIGDTAQVPNAAGDNQVRIGNTFITYAGIQVPWTITSDKRWKSDIKPSNLGLDFISKLNPVSYYRNNDKNKKTEYGFIAQELEETLHNAGATNNGIITKDDAGMYSVRYNDLMAPMVKAIQEQQEIIKNQQALIEKIDKINQELQSRLEKLEKK